MRVRRSVLLAIVTLLAVSALAAPASAGGSWLTPERSAYVPAETAVFRGSFGTGSLEGRIADGPYFAYLLPQDRWIHGHAVPASAIRLGELTIVRTSGQSFDARLEFEVPDVPTGMYHIGYCNEPCTVDGIGDLIGGESFAIGATRTEARLLILTERLRWKVDAAAARARQEALTERKRFQEALSERTFRSWGPVAGALLLLGLGLLVVIMVLATRLRRARVDAELHALTHDEPVGAER